MKVIDYYKKGLDGEGFPPPETFDSEYEFDEAWKEYTRGQNERYENKYKGKNFIRIRV